MNPNYYVSRITVTNNTGETVVVSSSVGISHTGAQTAGPSGNWGPGQSLEFTIHQSGGPSVQINLANGQVLRATFQNVVTIQ